MIDKLKKTTVGPLQDEQTRERAIRDLASELNKIVVQVNKIIDKINELSPN